MRKIIKEELEKKKIEVYIKILKSLFIGKSIYLARYDALGEIVDVYYGDDMMFIVVININFNTINKNLTDYIDFYYMIDMFEKLNIKNWGWESTKRRLNEETENSKKIETYLILLNKLFLNKAIHSDLHFSIHGVIKEIEFQPKLRRFVFRIRRKKGDKRESNSTTVNQFKKFLEKQLDIENFFFFNQTDNLLYHIEWYQDDDDEIIP